MWQPLEPLKLIILVGIQASGKTSFFRRHLAKESIHVSLDNWRGKGNVRAKEFHAIEEGLDALAAGKAAALVVDNTNASVETRRRYFDYAALAAARLGRPVELTAYWFDEPLADCLARNALRPLNPPTGEPYFVPPSAIAACHARLQPPTYSEGFSRIFRVRITGPEEFEVRELPH